MAGNVLQRFATPWVPKSRAQIQQKLVLIERISGIMAHPVEESEAATP
jgi:hypothetical protein